MLYYILYYILVYISLYFIILYYFIIYIYMCIYMFVILNLYCICIYTWLHMCMLTSFFHLFPIVVFKKNISQDHQQWLLFFRHKTHPSTRFNIQPIWPGFFHPKSLWIFTFVGCFPQDLPPVLQALPLHGARGQEDGALSVRTHQGAEWRLRGWRSP